MEVFIFYVSHCKSTTLEKKDYTVNVKKWIHEIKSDWNVEDIENLGSNHIRLM